MRQELEAIVAEAERDGLVVSGKAAALSAYLAGRGIGPIHVATLSASAAARLEDSEQPRFVRGFHDILITIGILVLTAGVLGLGSVFAVLPVVIGLSEIFVRRQRLALPSVVLSVLFVAAASFAAMLLPKPWEAKPWDTNMIAMAVTSALSAGLYHWRYRTPISLAGVYFGLALAVFLEVVRLTFDNVTIDTATSGNILPVATATILSLGLFAIAMVYDLSDPARVTRRSDVAFWLHLGAAPLLLHAMIALFSGGADVLPVLEDPQTAILVILGVLFLMTVGLVIDRRAFVTSGLISLGVALGTLMKNNLADLLDISFWIVAVAVGVIVLSIGIFWQPLRRLTLDLLPPALRRRLPPVR